MRLSLFPYFVYSISMAAAASAKVPMPAFTADPSTQLFVGQLLPGVTSTKLEAHFAAFKGRCVYTRPDRPYAFMQFADQATRDAAQRALDGSQMDGGYLTLRKSVRLGRTNELRLIFTGLNPDWGFSDVRRHVFDISGHRASFADVGLFGQGSALVRFPTESDAVLAHAKLAAHHTGSTGVRVELDRAGAGGGGDTVKSVPKRSRSRSPVRTAAAPAAAPRNRSRSRSPTRGLRATLPAAPIATRLPTLMPPPGIVTALPATPTPSLPVPSLPLAMSVPSLMPAAAAPAAPAQKPPIAFEATSLPFKFHSQYGLMSPYICDGRLMYSVNVIHNGTPATVLLATYIPSPPFDVMPLVQMPDSQFVPLDMLTTVVRL